ncbi:MAG: HAMP domain-containing histidine kinase [Lachnospiraceae bacterium]|nr:HAMP domain-containing histidine kinase [Lachnospiraceae bacterium]
MFKKVHIRLTLLCAGITALIMTVVSFIFLYVSEHELYQNQLQAFQNDINTITTNLEQQSVISMEWLSKMEAQGNYRFIITDNGIPFLYNKLNDKETNSGFNNTDYLEITIRPGDNSSSLEINVFYSLESLEKQIKAQRIRFIFIDTAAVFILTVFSWFFTGKLLQPIIENQQKQTEFIASASHELRTPLAVILSAAECCKTAPPDNQEGFLKTIHQETLRMSTLVNDMLTLSSSDNNRFTVKIQSIELDTLLINIYDAFKPIAEDKAIELTINLPEKALPPCSADPDRISQVISILMHNAISYTQELGKVELSLSHSKEHFYISVKDNGIGISDEDKKKIFDRFYRAEKSRSTKEHFGLGLSIAYEIVTAHGGNISVTDAEGGGSVFTVRL